MSHLSQQTGISKNALSDLYYEKTKGIQFDTLEKICAALNCKVADVLEYITDEQREEKAE